MIVNPHLLLAWDTLLICTFVLVMEMKYVGGACFVPILWNMSISSRCNGGQSPQVLVHKRSYRETPPWGHRYLGFMSLQTIYRCFDHSSKPPELKCFSPHTGLQGQQYIDLSDLRQCILYFADWPDSFNVSPRALSVVKNLQTHQAWCEDRHIASIHLSIQLSMDTTRLLKVCSRSKIWCLRHGD